MANQGSNPSVKLRVSEPTPAADGLLSFTLLVTVKGRDADSQKVNIVVDGGKWVGNPHSVQNGTVTIDVLNLEAKAHTFVAQIDGTDISDAVLSPAPKRASTKVDKVLVTAPGSNGKYKICVTVRSEADQLLKGVLVRIFNKRTGALEGGIRRTDADGTIEPVSVRVLLPMEEYVIDVAGNTQELRLLGEVRRRRSIPPPAEMPSRPTGFFSPLMSLVSGFRDAGRAIEKEKKRVRKLRHSDALGGKR